jgi:hypothetical protein
VRRKAFAAANPTAGGYFLLPSFFEALSGSTVPLPAKPRRSRGGFLAFDMST